MATPASAYPRLSADGLSVVAGDRVLVKDRSVELGSGIGGQFGADGWIYFGGHDGVFRRWRDGVIEVVREHGFNAFVVAFGRWLGWRPDTGLVWPDGGTWFGWHSPALSETRWAAIHGTTLFAGLGDGQAGQVVAEHARDPRLVGNLLTWVQDEPGGAMSVLGQWFHGGAVRPLSIPGNTKQGYITAVMIDGEAWALSHDDVRAFLYPWDDTSHGYVVAHAPAKRPDGRQKPDRIVRCVWDAEDNVLGEKLIDVRTETRVDLRPPATPQPERLPEGTEIDLLPFLVGEASTWPRDGDHYMHQTWDGRNLHFLKFGATPAGSTFCDTWERLVLDGDQFYLREDRSQSGAGIYSFHPGTAFKRRMRVGEWVNVSNNVLQRYEKGTCRVIDQHPLPYRLGLVEAWLTFDCGGDLGVRDVVKCSYDPGSDKDSIEHFWYARGAGWFRWQEQRQDDPSKTHTTTFNRIGGQALTPTEGCWRRDLVPWPPSNQQVGMTIIEPTTYPATATGNRFRAVCGPEPGEHWSSWVEWIYRRVGESSWTQQGERRNPRDDDDHTFTFPGSGDYEIGLRWSSGHTGRQRIVRVGEPVIQPPPPPPPPEQTTMQIQTNDWQHYITVSSSGKATATQTSADHATVQLTLVRGDDGRFALRGPNGKVGSAQLDGTFTFDRERGADWKPDGWEALRAEPSSLGGESYVTDHGTRLAARNEGGSELYHHQAPFGIAGDETFYPSVSLVGGHVGGGPVGPVPDSGLDRIDGQLGLEPGGGFHVNGRAVLPTLCHYGDALSKWMRDRSHVLRNLDLIAAAGYHGTRYWTCLDGAWWNGRHVGERFQSDYWEQHRAFLLAHKERGLVCQISQGSTTSDALPDPHGFMHRLCDVLQDVGPEVAAVIEGVNEDRDTGNRGPEWLAEFVGIAASRIPQLLRGLSSYTGTEDPVILNRYSRDPAQMFMVHPYRGGRNHDKTRHLMSLQYENGANARVMAGARLASADLARIASDIDASRRQTALETADWLQRHMPHRAEEIARLLAIGSGQIARLSAAEAEAMVRLMRRNGWNSEGPGIGNRVSAIDNRDEMTGATMCGLAAMSFMMRMAYVNFYGVGVISDDGGSQTFDQMPGFFEVPKVRALVPADVMRYSGPIFHGGETWRNDRTFAARGDVRADHVVHHDGRRVIGIYGPGDLNVPQERGFSADIDHRFDNEFRLVVGRAA